VRWSCLAPLLACVLCVPAWAEEEDRALLDFARPAARAPRGQPVLPQAWERTLRPANCQTPERAPGATATDCFGPPALRDTDAALLMSARAGRWGEALQLLKSGQAGANPQDDAGGHVLVLAARAGQDELVRELLKRGADTERIGEDGFTALGAAAFAGHRSTVRLLLRAGVDITRRGATGQTALHLAGIGGQVPVLEEMLRVQHADIELLNGHRESVLDVAGAANQQAAMDYLIQAGANLDQAGRR
jgi:hypothetical protein